MRFHDSPPVAKSKKLSTKLFGLYNDESIISHRMILKRYSLFGVYAGTIGKVQDQHLFVVPVLFCCLKISLNNFTDRVTNLISVVSVRAKRGKNLHALTTFTGRR